MNRPNPSQRPRILHADSDAEFQSALANSLQQFGFDCDVVVSAAEARERLLHSNFDALIAEIQIPGNENLELVEHLSRLNFRLPVVILTAHPTIETAAHAVRLPVVAYLTKPPNLNDLCAVLNRAVDSQRQNRISRDLRRRLNRWENELGSVEQQSGNPLFDDVDANAGFLQITLRNVIQTLKDLDEAMSIARNSNRGLKEAELISAIRRTVSVLRKTKQNFKSKELGALREQLEQILGGEPAADTEESFQ
jgi:CheY-like chemotaxis protein